MITIDDNGSLMKLASGARAQAKKLQPAVNDVIEHSLQDTKRRVAQRAATILPRRGGLAARVAQLDLTVRRSSQGAALIGRSKYDIKSIDGGLVRHPVYGHHPLVAQTVRPGFWSEPIAASESDLQARIIKTVDDVVNNI